jgi:hypothetical protein
VAVLSELGRQDEAVKEMNISLEKGAAGQNLEEWQPAAR